MLEDSLHAFLAADTALGALVEDRIYGGAADPDSELPHLVYSRLATLRGQTLCGTDRTARAQIEIDCADRSFKASKDLAKVVKDTLLDFSGDMAGTRISAVILDSDGDLVYSEPGLFYVSQVYFIWFKEE